MHLIAPLASGVVGAESGFVGIFNRGTSTRATYYTDFEGDSAVTPTADIALDSSGRLVAYVATLVDVVVLDSDGASVVSFTAGVAAAGVEVISQSFTGVDYESAASAASNPTTLSALLDLWYTQNGAVDWKVLFGGAATTLRAALSGLGGLVYNVTNSTYGATGDGTTDDTSAIAAAITACNAAGGGIVWFPEGTYRTTSALTISDKVSLAGPGAHCTTISIDHASANAVNFSGSTTRVWQQLVGLRIVAGQSNNGTHLSIASGTLLRMHGVSIGSSNTAGLPATVATSTTTRVVADSCDFTSAGNGGALFYMTTTARRVTLINCEFVAPATMTGQMVYGTTCDVVRCRFDFSALTSGTLAGFEANTTSMFASVTDCLFTADGGAGVSTAIKLGTVSATGVFRERGNRFLCDTAYSATISNANYGMVVELGSRVGRVLVATNAASSYEVPVLQYGHINLTSSYAGNVALTAETYLPPGAECRITIYNSDASSRNFTPNASYYDTAAKAIGSAGANVMRISADWIGAATASLHNLWRA